jgi:hypothetical protein
MFAVLYMLKSESTEGQWSYSEVQCIVDKCTCRINGGRLLCLMSECLESGGIFTTELELESFMIDLMFPLMAVWQCSAPLVRRWISTYHLKLNGKLMTGKHKHYIFLSLPVTMTWRRLLYRPQLVVDGNMKLVHLIQG